jgi:hypothetical protein
MVSLLTCTRAQLRLKNMHFGNGKRAPKRRKGARGSRIFQHGANDIKSYVSPPSNPKMFVTQSIYIQPSFRGDLIPDREPESSGPSKIVSATGDDSIGQDLQIACIRVRSFAKIYAI